MGSFWGSPGTLQSAPGLLWDTFWRAWGADVDRFGMILGTQGGVRSENSDKLEFDDPLHENAVFRGFGYLGGRQGEVDGKRLAEPSGVKTIGPKD